MEIFFYDASEFLEAQYLLASKSQDHGHFRIVGFLPCFLSIELLHVIHILSLNTSFEQNCVNAIFRPVLNGHVLALNEPSIHFLKPKELVELVQRAICKLQGYTVRILRSSLNSDNGQSNCQ